MLPSDQHCASAKLFVELSGPLAFCLRSIAQALVWREAISRARGYVDVSSRDLSAVQSEHIPYIAGEVVPGAEGLPALTGAPIRHPASMGALPVRDSRRIPELAEPVPCVALYSSIYPLQVCCTWELI